MKWLEARSKVLPRIVPALTVTDAQVGVPWVNDCWLVPVIDREAVVSHQVRRWGEEMLGGGLPTAESVFAACGAEAAESLISLAVSNLSIREVARRSIRGMVCPAASKASVYSHDCAASDASDGFAASRLLLPGLWWQVRKVLGQRAQFWVAAPCDDCLAIFRTEEEARRLLASPALRGKDNPRPICLEPFVLTRDGIAGIPTFAEMGGAHAAD